MLTEEQIQSYKERLEKERAELLKELDENSRPANFGHDDTADPEDEEADEAEEFSNETAKGAVFREQIEQITEALERIQNGTYGKCMKCGGEIEKEVLDAVPESNLCEKCKK